MLERIKKRLIQALTWFCILILIGITVLVAIGIVSRYVFNDPVGWTEELSRILQVWLTFLGAPLAILCLAHIVINFLPERLRGKSKAAILAIIYGTVIFFATFMFFQGLLLTSTTWRMKIVTLDISQALSLYLILPISSVLIIVAAGMNLIGLIRGSKANKEEN